MFLKILDQGKNTNIFKKPLRLKVYKETQNKSRQSGIEIVCLFGGEGGESIGVGIFG